MGTGVLARKHGRVTGNRPRRAGGTSLPARGLGRQRIQVGRQVSRPPVAPQSIGAQGVQAQNQDVGRGLSHRTAGAGTESEGQE